MVAEESRWQRSQDGGVWGNGSRCVHTQDVETENLGARLAFSFLLSLRAQPINCIIHIWDWVCLCQLTLSRNPLIDTPRDLFQRWPQVHSSWPSSPHVTVEKNQGKQQAAFTPPELTDLVLLAKYLLKDLPRHRWESGCEGLRVGTAFCYYGKRFVHLENARLSQAWALGLGFELLSFLEHGCLCSLRVHPISFEALDVGFVPWQKIKQSSATVFQPWKSGIWGG